jgi:cytochrome c
MTRTLIFSSCLALGLLSSVVAKSQTADPKKDIETGKLLISKSDCFACHKPDTKLVGPAYADIAKKYKATDANVTLLSGKVIKGGSGNWGQIPMAAHPQVTALDAKKMVKYILSIAPAKK